MSLATEFAQNEDDQANKADLNCGNSLKVGDFVGLIEEDSTLAQPQVLIAQIQSFQTDNQANLLWYHMSNKQNEYTFQFEQQPWVESIESLHPVDMRPMKRRQGTYKLYTSHKAIHKALSKC